jgi:hypothetical protein
MQATKPEIFSITAFISTFVAFLFGLLSARILEAIKHWHEKQGLINLFLDEIRRTYKEIESKKSAGPAMARSKSELFGVKGLNLVGMPEYQLEVYNTKLFDTEGVRLAQYLGTGARKSFWAAYGCLRDAEAVRQVLKELTNEDRDYEAYQKVFVELIVKATDSLTSLEHALDKERSFIETLREMRAAPNS